MQSPLQPSNSVLPSGVCVSVTTTPGAWSALQTPLATPLFTVQLMPTGVLVIVPLPRDAGDGATVSMTGITAAVNAAATVLMAPSRSVAMQV